MRVLSRIAGVWLCATAVAPEQPAPRGVPACSLIDAVKSGSTQAVSALLKQKTDVNAAEADGTTALHHAAYANNLELTRMLLRAGANANAVNRYGVAPLRLAVEAGNAAVVEALLKAGANANATLPEGESVLMTAARTGDPATVRQLLVAGAKVNAAEATQGQTPLMYAARREPRGGGEGAGRRRRRRQRQVEAARVAGVQVQHRRHDLHAAAGRRLDGRDVCRARGRHRRRACAGRRQGGPEPGRSRRHHAAHPGDRQRQVRYGGRAARQRRQPERGRSDGHVRAVCRRATCTRCRR